jgi:hypothetical protein
MGLLSALYNTAETPEVASALGKRSALLEPPSDISEYRSDDGSDDLCGDESETMEDDISDRVEDDISGRVEAVVSSSTSTFSTTSEQAEAVSSLLQLSSNVPVYPKIGTTLLVHVGSYNTTTTTTTSSDSTTTSTTTTNQDPTVGFWEKFVPRRFCEALISAQPPISKADQDIMAEHMTRDYGEGIIASQQRKLSAIEQIFLVLMKTPVQDPRSLPDNNPDTAPDTAPRYIIQVDKMEDEIISGVERFLRPGRDFTVHDPLAFNLVVREMIAKHPFFKTNLTQARSRGTTAASEVLARIGIGPPVAAVTHSAPKFRGPIETDPKIIHPDDGSKQSGKERDGMYYRRYTSKLVVPKLRHTRHKRSKRTKTVD